MPSKDRSDDGAWSQMRGIFGSMRQHKSCWLEDQPKPTKTPFKIIAPGEDPMTATDIKSVQPETSVVD